ncbi:MAG: hypothetical protein J7J20_03305 [Desulfurococcales archaeon]|nr:hypothetical protein [Desulfurococcales archaeon]
MPEGIMRSSTIIISGPAGTGKSVILTHVAHSFLSRGEEVVYVTFDDSPEALLELFRSFKWDPVKYVDQGLLKIVDGFSFRLGSLRKPIKGVVKEVRPEDPSRTLYTINELLEEHKIENRGCVIIDSLNELMFKLDITQVLEFVKSVRAIVSKGRAIATFFTLHTTTDALMELRAHLEYLVDGLIETRIEPNLQEMGIPLKQLMVKKMRGVPTNPLWMPYVIISEGIRLVDQSKLAALVKARLKEAIGGLQQGAT